MESFKNFTTILVVLVGLILSFILSSMLLTIISFDAKAIFNLLNLKADKFNFIFSILFVIILCYYTFIFIKNALSSIFYEEKFVDDQMRISIKIFIFGFVNSLLIAISSFAKVKMTNTTPTAYIIIVVFITILSLYATKLIYAYFENKFERLQESQEDEFDENRLKYEAKRRAKLEEKNVWKR